MAYLDENGLEHFWGKIKDHVSSDVAPKADDADVVHNTGDETVGGVKTFKNTAASYRAGETVTALAIRNSEITRGVPLSAGRSWTHVVLADKEGDIGNSAGRLGLFEARSPRENDTLGEEVKIRCYKYSSNPADASKSVDLAVGYDAYGVPYAIAPETSDDRSYSGDIVTRNFLESSEWNWQKTKKAGAVAFKPVPESDLEPVVDFMFTEIPPAEGEKGPENPSTITGVSAVNVSHRGKNLIPYPFYETSKTYNGITWTVYGDGSVTADGTASGLSAFYVAAPSSALNAPAGTYTLSGVPEGASQNTYNLYAYDANNTRYYDNSNGTTFQSPSPIVGLNIRIPSGVTVSNIVFRPQLELGSAATPFEPYSGDEYTIQLGDTYYGGSLDVATGVMTVTWVGGLVPVKSFQYHIDGIVGFQWDLSGNPIFTGSVHTDTDLTCTHFPNSTNSSQYLERINLSGPDTGTAWGGFIHISDSRIGGSGLTNAQYLTNMQQYITDNNVMFAAKVYAPFTVQLTPTQIRSLPALDKYEPRVNTVYTDQEAVQVGYQRYANYVDLTTNQNIAGTKYFMVGPAAKSTSFDVTNDSTTQDFWRSFWFCDKNNQNIVVQSIHYGTNRAFSLRMYDKSGSQNWIMSWVIGHDSSGRYVSCGGDFRPTSPNNYTLGNASYKWKEIWCTQSSINSSSDERIKSNIKSIPDNVLDVWENVNWIEFQYNDAISEKGENARLHTGLIAQRVASIFKQADVQVDRYGFYLYDKWDSEEASFDENGNEIKPAIEAGDAYGIRYTEALCMEAAYMRRENAHLKKRVADLEERLAALELRLGSE